MGKKLDALLGRNFKTSKFRALVNLAITRAVILKKQRQVRCSQARSDVVQLLNLGHHERALIRVIFCHVWICCFTCEFGVTFIESGGLNRLSK